MPVVEEYGVEPIPDELRTARWPTLFSMNLTFFVNPVMYVLGALPVVVGGLPLWGAMLALLLGQAVAYAVLVVLAQPGTDHGLPGQVALRASLGYWGSRLLSSPYRVIAATYWFASQALASALGVQAIWLGLTGHRISLVPVSLALAAVHATIAVLGFDVQRWLIRVMLPLTLGFAAALVVLYLASDDPRYAVGHVLRSPDQHFTWTALVAFVTVTAGASLTFATNVADYCRYTPTRRDVRVGYLSSALVATSITTFIGAYAAVAVGDSSPFAGIAELTSSRLLLACLLVALLAQSVMANIGNVYTAGLSLVNTVPQLGRVRATLAVAAASISLSALPDVVNDAATWITHLGNVAAPLAGTLVADYLVVKRGRLDVPALFQPLGRYRYTRGVNLLALVSVGVGVGVYYAVPDGWVKVLWGLGVAGLVYVACWRAVRRASPVLDRVVGAGASVATADAA